MPPLLGGAGPERLIPEPETLSRRLLASARDAILGSMTSPANTQANLRQSLLARLARLKAPVDVQGAIPYGAPGQISVFGYCARSREEIRQSRLDDPALVVVLEGVKEVWRGDVRQRFESGWPFAMPGGVKLDIVNIPDPRSGRYESICINVDADLRHTIWRAMGQDAISGAASGDGQIVLTSDLVEAYGHAAVALSEGRNASVLARHRILEILLLLADTPAAGLLFAATLAERVQALIRADPAKAWQVDEVARSLGLGASTLRRRLKLSGTSFRDILSSTRMSAAHSLLGASKYSVTQAAQAAGYVSRSHFARRFRAAHGLAPSQLRERA
jgi:AraC-like DNA-binding protein